MSASIFTVTLPFFLLIFAGIFAGKRGLLTSANMVGFNNFIFWFALPGLLFDKMLAAPLSNGLDPGVIIAYSGAGLIVYAVGFVGARRMFGLSIGESAIQGMAGAFGNIGYMGLPIILVLFGEKAVLPAVAILVMDNLILIALTTALIEGGREGGQALAAIARAIKAVARNPLILATAAGLVCNLTEASVPALVRQFAMILGQAAAPCALFALGASLAERGFGRDWGETSFMTANKILLHPLLAWIIAFPILGLDPLLGAVVVIEASLPIAANVFIQARAYNVYMGPTSAAVLLSTLLASLSVPFVMAAFAG